MDLDGSVPQEVKDMAIKMKFLKSQGIFDASPVNTSLAGRFSNALLAGGDSLTGTNNYANRMNNQAALQKQQMESMAKAAQTNVLTPEQQIMNAYRQESLQGRKDQQQNQVEQNAIARLSSVRGDVPMSKVEQQRDAAISAYNTIQSAEHENRLPTQIEYLDLLGQLWKSRTGTAPTEQVLKEFNVGTMQQRLNKVGQYFTGKPMGANTKEVISALKDFVYTTGNSLDQTHEGYFKNHLIRPSGISDDKWNELKQMSRGNSFKEGIAKYKDSLQSPLSFADKDKEARYQAWKAQQK